ncbi:MAG: TetR/AcrR family transcriptional regulator [Gemmatimonadota bacterium]
MKRSVPSNRRGAPRTGRWERKPEVREDEILDAALEVFAVNGYRGTRLEQIGQAAGVTKGTIYHYFTSKEQLLLEAARRRRSRVFAETEAVMANQAEPASVRLRRGHHMAWHRWCNPQSRQLLRLMISEVSVEAPAVFKEWLGEGFLRGIRMVADLIEQGKKSGEFRPDVDSEVTARVLNSGMLFHLLLHFEMGLNDLAPMDVERFIDSSLDSMLNGLWAGQVSKTHSANPECAAVGDWLETGLALLQRGALNGVLGNPAAPAQSPPSTEAISPSSGNGKRQRGTSR